MPGAGEARQERGATAPDKCAYARRCRGDGLGALQDGKTADIEIQRVGKMTQDVSDPLKRNGNAASTWGASINPDAVKRRRLQ